MPSGACSTRAHVRMYIPKRPSFTRAPNSCIFCASVFKPPAAHALRSVFSTRRTFLVPAPRPPPSRLVSCILTHISHPPILDRGGLVVCRVGGERPLALRRRQEDRRGGGVGLGCPRRNRGVLQRAICRARSRVGGRSWRRVEVRVKTVRGAVFSSFFFPPRFFGRLVDKARCFARAASPSMRP